MCCWGIREDQTVGEKEFKIALTRLGFKQELFIRFFELLEQ